MREVRTNDARVESEGLDQQIPVHVHKNQMPGWHKDKCLLGGPATDWPGKDKGLTKEQREELNRIKPSWWQAALGLSHQ